MDVSSRYLDDLNHLLFFDWYPGIDNYVYQDMEYYMSRGREVTKEIINLLDTANSDPDFDQNIFLDMFDAIFRRLDYQSDDSIPEEDVLAVGSKFRELGLVQQYNFTTNDWMTKIKGRSVDISRSQNYRDRYKGLYDGLNSDEIPVGCRDVSLNSYSQGYVDGSNYVDYDPYDGLDFSENGYQ